MVYGSYDRIDRLRDDLERAKKRREEAEQRVKNCEAKLRDAENNQIIAEVNALKLTPEEVARFLQMAASGQIQTKAPAASITPKADPVKDSSDDIYDYDESEDTEDEEN